MRGQESAVCCYYCDVSFLQSLLFIQSFCNVAGVESTLDYLQKLGVGVISLSPIYASFGSAATFRTDSDTTITNHTTINMIYGTMTEFESLVDAVHSKGDVLNSHMFSL